MSWGQKMARVERLSALTTVKTVGALHCHFGPGLGVNINQLMSATARTMQTVGPNKWRENVRTFFSVVDQAFGLRSIAFRDQAPWLKTSFLLSLAMLMAEHKTFWDGTRLIVPKGFIEKLKKFPVSNREVVGLLSSSSAVSPIFYRELVGFIDSGKRSGHMIKWNGVKADGILSMQAEETFEESAEEFSSEEAILGK